MNLVVTRGAPREYFDVDSQRLNFSASQILAVLDPHAFDDVDYETLEGAQYRGRRVHTLFARLLAWKAGLMLQPTCDSGYQGYYDSMLALIEAERLEPLLVEHKDMDPKLPIAGTFDAKVLWGRERIITLTDLKTGKQRRRAHKVQLQLYRRFPSCQDVKKMATIYAQKDGSKAQVEWVKRSAEDEAWMLNSLYVLMGREYE